MAVDINDTPNRVRYTATAAQTAFSVPFQFLAAADLKLYQNGVLKTLSTHYTVTGAGASSGTLTLVSGAAVSDDILIVRDMPVQRIGDFPVSGPFDVASLNDQLDGLTMMVRDLETRSDRRSLRLAETDLPETLGALPSKASRANRTLGFDANGNPQTGTPLVPEGWTDYQTAAAASASNAATSASNASASATTASTQAGIATTQAGIATSGAATATAQATAATSAKTAAEAAATAALAAAKTYVSTAAGLAATTSGQVFLVSTASPQIFEVYTNNAGAASLIGTLNIADGSFFIAAAPLGYQWSVLDGDGKAAVGIKNDGTFAASAAEISDLGVTNFNGLPSAGVSLAAEYLFDLVPSGYQWSVLDGENKAAVGIKNDGTFTASALEVDSLTVSEINGIPIENIIDEVAPLGFIAEINHIPTYGQSLSLIGNIISTTQPYDSLKFNSGLTAFVALTGDVPSAGTGETPAPGTGHGIKHLIASENNITYTQQSYQLLFSADGQGGTSVAGLSKPSTPYTRLIASVQAGFNVAQGLGKSFNVPAITWTQGEEDYNINTSAATYKTNLSNFLTTFDADVKVITGQTNDLKLIMYQVASHKYYSKAYPTIALAQLEQIKANPKMFMAAPMYQFDYTDNVHVDGDSIKKLGFHYGLAYKRVVIDGSAWQPLMPISKYKQGAVAVIEFNVPYGKLVFDTTLVAANTNYGFNLFDSSNNAITISSVSITGPSTVKIIAASTIPAGAKLQYAFYGSGIAGRTTGPRGNLRDTQGSSIVFDPSGLNYPAHNWCVMFEEIF